MRKEIFSCCSSNPPLSARHATVSPPPPSAAVITFFFPWKSVCRLACRRRLGNKALIFFGCCKEKKGSKASHFPTGSPNHPSCSDKSHPSFRFVALHALYSPPFQSPLPSFLSLFLLLLLIGISLRNRPFPPTFFLQGPLRLGPFWTYLPPTYIRYTL